jgi:hypothetical protein
MSLHMPKLTQAGVVLAERGAQRQWYRLTTDFLLAARQMPLGEHESPKDAPVSGDSDHEAMSRAKVIRDFFTGERLKEIPGQRKRCDIVLRCLMERFEADRTYKDLEVNDRLCPAHADVATLRRELVDYGFMQRNRGIYQLTRGDPSRGKQVQQEISGNDDERFATFIAKPGSFDPEQEAPDRRFIAIALAPLQDVTLPGMDIP